MEEQIPQTPSYNMMSRYSFTRRSRLKQETIPKRSNTRTESNLNGQELLKSDPINPHHLLRTDHVLTTNTSDECNRDSIMAAPVPKNIPSFSEESQVASNTTGEPLTQSTMKESDLADTSFKDVAGTQFCSNSTFIETFNFNQKTVRLYIPAEWKYTHTFYQ